MEMMVAIVTFRVVEPIDPWMNPTIAPSVQLAGESRVRSIQAIGARATSQT